MASHIYRDKIRGKICGVCVGLADYFGISSFALRIVALISLFFFTFGTIAVYFALALLLDNQPTQCCHESTRG